MLDSRFLVIASLLMQNRYSNYFKNMILDWSLCFNVDQYSFPSNYLYLQPCDVLLPLTNTRMDPNFAFVMLALINCIS